MNRVFKTTWSSVHQQYVVTDEKLTSRGKASKSVLTLAVAAAAVLVSGAAAAAYVPTAFSAQPAAEYVEQGKVGAGHASTWESDEYKKDWGLAAMNASSAYAPGFTGKGVAVGVMDSGALLQKHPDLAGDRFHAVAVPGQSYGSEGNRYPQDGSNPGHYEPGSEVPADGNWVSGMNDSHGTHVTGSVGANRDGSEFHGVAFESDVYVGNIRAARTTPTTAPSRIRSSSTRVGTPWRPR